MKYEKIVLLSLIFIFIITSYSCSEEKNIHYFLEENDTNIIMNITNIDIMKSNLLVNDASTGCLFIYNLQNGNLIKSIRPNIYYSDSIAIKLNLIDLGYQRQYVTLKELFFYKGSNYDPEKISKWINNLVLISYFENDSIIVSLGRCSVNSITKNEKELDDWFWGMENSLVIILQNIISNNSNIEPLLSYKISDSQYYLPFPSIFNVNTQVSGFLCHVILSDTNKLNKKKDTIYNTAIFSQNGKLKSFYSKKPKYFDNVNILEGSVVKGIFNRNINEFILIYQNISSIFIKDLEIKLKDFPSDNNYFMKYQNDKNIDSKIKNYIENNEPLSDFKFLNIFHYNDNILLYIAKYDTSVSKIKISLFEYNIDGSLIRIYPIKLYDDDLSLPIIYMNKEKNDKILMIRKLEVGWYAKWFDNLQDLND